MKKTISLLLALMMCLSLCACGGGNDTPATEAPLATEAPSEVVENSKIPKEDLLSVAVPMTQAIVEQITAKGTGKDFAKTLISNTYTFTGKVYAEETDYVGIGIRVPNADGELLGYDYQSTLSFYVYLPAEELANVDYDDTITIVGKITDVFREERKDAMYTDMTFPVTVIVMGEAYINE